MSQSNRPDLSTHAVRILFFSLVILFLASILFGLKELAIPFSVAFLLSILLTPAVDFFEGLGINRGLSVTIVLALLVGLVYGTVAIVLPLAYSQSGEISSELARLSAVLPPHLESFRDRIAFILPEHYRTMKIDVPWILDLITGPIKDLNILEMLPRLITYAIITPIVLFIFLLQGDELFRNVMVLVPNRYFEMTLLIIHQIKSGIISYLKGLSMQVLILAAIFIPGLLIAGVPYAAALGAFAAAVNIIPYAGPVIGAAPIVVLSLIGGEGLLMPAVLALAAGHLVDNVFTQPVILARSVDVHPLIAVLAVITFEQWLGVAGMVIALPVAGIMVMTIETMYRSLKSFGVI